MNHHSWRFLHFQFFFWVFVLFQIRKKRLFLFWKICHRQSWHNRNTTSRFVFFAIRKFRRLFNYWKKNISNVTRTCFERFDKINIIVIAREIDIDLFIFFFVDSCNSCEKIVDKIEFHKMSIEFDRWIDDFIHDVSMNSFFTKYNNVKWTMW